VKAQAGILESDDVETVEQKLDESVASLVADEQERGFVTRHLRTLVGVAGDTATEERATAFAAWTRFVEALAELRPTVLVFEDMHWADDALLDFVEHLLDWAGDVPLLVVGTTRPELLERRPTWGGGRTNVATVALAPLSREETAMVVTAVLGRALLPAETQQELLERAGGNPLYAEQYARLFAERGEADGDVPETVQAIIGARIDALAPPEKVLLQDAAVVGKVFWPGALRSIAERDSECTSLLHSLERKEFVRRERRPSVAGEQEYAFRHLLVRDVAYAQIPRRARSAKHRAAAAWIESLGSADDHAEMVARHYTEALEYARSSVGLDPELQERTRAALVHAGDRARSLHAHAAAARFYRKALDLWEEGNGLQRAHVLFRLGVSLERSERAGGTELDQARDALLAAGDVDTAAEAEAVHADALAKIRSADARPRFERALALVENRPPSRAKAYVLARSSNYAVSLGEDAWSEHASTALSIADAAGADDIRVQALTTLAFAKGRSGALADESEALRQAIEIARASDIAEIVRVEVNYAAVLQSLGELARTFEVQAEARRDAERFGVAELIMHLRSEQVLENYWSGRWDEAVHGAGELLADLAGGEDYVIAGIACHLVRAHVLVARDDVAGALAAAERAAAAGRSGPAWGALAWALTGQARVIAEAGTAAEAADAAAAALRELRTAGPTIAAYTAAELSFVPGRRAEALQTLIEPCRTESLWLEAAFHALAGRWVEAADVYRRIGSVPDEADAQLRSGDEAQVRKALAFYRSVGATRYVRQAESLLPASA
jgi:hypothetical protein